MVRKLLNALVDFYQRFISPFLGGNCRYYPSCSEYAKWRLAVEPAWKAIFFSIFRILRCNKLFSGGVEYPKVKLKISKSESAVMSKPKIKICFWLVPTGQKDVFYLIKSF